MWRVLGVLIVILSLGLIACAEDAEEPTQAAPAPNTNPNIFGLDEGIRSGTQQANSIATFQAQTRIARTLAVVTATPRPTSTIDPQFIVTFTPVPTVEIDDDTDFIGNSYVDQTWLQYGFTASNRSEFTVGDFLGTVIVISLIDPTCAACIDEVSAVRAGAELFQQQLSNSDADAIFLALNVSSSISLESLNFVAERDGYSSNLDISWLTGLASSSLRTALLNTFGDDLFTRDTLPVIFLDTNGVAHLTTGNIVDDSYIRDALVFYNGGFGDDGEEIDIDDGMSPE